MTPRSNLTPTVRRLLTDALWYVDDQVFWCPLHGAHPSLLFRKGDLIRCFDCRSEVTLVQNPRMTRERRRLAERLHRLLDVA